MRVSELDILEHASKRAGSRAITSILMCERLICERLGSVQVEINPLVEAEDGSAMCLDAKLGFDDNAK